MKTAALALAALALGAAAGCGSGGTVEPGTEPDLARLVCGDEGARFLTPRAEARPDGLHLEVTNEGSKEAHVTIEGGRGDDDGLPAPPGTSTHVLTIGPGEWTATCYDVGPLQTDAFELVDTGIWVSTEITDCETTESVHGDPPRRIEAEEDELAEIARGSLESFVGVEPGYELERAGYPEQTGAVFRAVADGRTLATMSFYPDESGAWSEGSATYCAEPGSGPEPSDGPAPDPSTY